MSVVWKSVSGFGGVFANTHKISSDGRLVRRCVIYKCGSGHKASRVLEEREIIGEVSKHGYRRVTLYNNGIKWRVFIHRLVAEAFVPNPDNKPEIDHINTNPTDNRAENLRWVTHKENQNNCLTKVKQKTAQIGEKNFWFGKKGVLHHASKKVRCIETGEIYFGAAEAERITGIKHINCCCRGARRTAGGFHWKFVKQ